MRYQQGLMFLPFRIKFLSKIPFPKIGKKRVVAAIATYFTTLFVIVSAAFGLQSFSINSLHSVVTENSINIAVSRMPDERINDVLQIVKSDSRVVDIFSDFDKDTQFLNYILPTEWFAAEIPMNEIGVGRGHHSPRNYDDSLYKIIITKAIPRNDGVAIENLLTNIHSIEPIVEIWVDLSEQNIIQILDMPKYIRYEGIPVAIF